MLTKDLYSLIDKELIEILDEYKNDQYIQKHKSSIDNQKSFAFLIWFLRFYGRISNYSDYITDGTNDSSCDIILDKIDSKGNKLFYVVQSKWNNANNSEGETSKDEIMKALNDFQTILSGEKKNLNEKLKIKIQELDAHLKANGQVKFVFLSLSQYKGGANDNITAFRNNDVKTHFEIIDINRIRVDYIDRNFKKIDPVNPLETYYNPEESKVVLEFVQKVGNIKIEKPYEAYVLLIRPKIIWELFKKFNFALFFKNVRNPLLQAQFNIDIEKTAKDESNLFWYYNNGITAITSILPELGKKAEQIEITGLQIINGAQTVYSIYRAYESATATQRLKMDNEALITLRLLKSGGSTFDLNVTRYTNSQNPVQDRDFCANDDIQVKLQNESYQTKVWYEKRRGEFRDIPEGIITVPNEEFAPLYLAYHLKDPTSAYIYGTNKEDKNLLFISHKDHKDGLYEKIFNENTKYEDMLAAYYVYKAVLKSLKSASNVLLYSKIWYISALFSVLFAKYMKAKFDSIVNINKHIIKIYEQDEKEIIFKTIVFLWRFFDEAVENNESNVKQKTKISFSTSLYEFQNMMKSLAELEITPEDIEGIELETILLLNKETVS